MDLGIIKLIMFHYGIYNLKVQFDAAGRKIVANYDRAGQHYKKEITFSEIESALTQGPIGAVVGSPGQKNP